ncbi:MAG: type II toxin-antitoxin system VapC family toxin [Bryobacter sp.]|nr:type II toxin-antitoxin system VapC family toxin [Bryobacter sp.]
MLIPDINLLVYAYDSTSPHHLSAKTWWIEKMSGRETVGIAWLVALGFIRLWTNPKIFEYPMTMEKALGHVESWLKRPAVKMINPGARHADILFRLLRESKSSGNITMDAHLAALAVETGGEIQSSDTDFLRFPGLRWKNPLE